MRVLKNLATFTIAFFIRIIYVSDLSGLIVHSKHSIIYSQAENLLKLVYLKCAGQSVTSLRKIGIVV